MRKRSFQIETPKTAVLYSKIIYPRKSIHRSRHSQHEKKILEPMISLQKGPFMAKDMPAYWQGVVYGLKKLLIT